MKKIFLSIVAVLLLSSAAVYANGGGKTAKKHVTKKECTKANCPDQSNCSKANCPSK
jgi:hypothetical protein